MNQPNKGYPDVSIFGLFPPLISLYFLLTF